MNAEQLRQPDAHGIDTSEGLLTIANFTPLENIEGLQARIRLVMCQANIKYLYKRTSLTRIFSTKNRAFGVNYFPNPQHMQVMGNINYSHRMPQVPRVFGG